ncbi:MAG: sugar diacid recognition domain-containing protein [Anaeromyxobacteraceae bacterium]
MDQDLRKLAGRFLDFVYHATSLPMIVCDEDGTIVQAVDRTRIGKTHAGAQRILRGEVEEVFVTDEEAAADPRMKAGCSVPIVIDGKRVGTFGLTGPSDVAQPLTRVASAVLASWLDEQRRQSALKHTADDVLSGVKGVSERAERASSEATAVVARMAATSRDAAEKVERSGAILRTVHEIAQTSRILSINGSVEAARAGERGRGFAVVAREMLDLAEHARGAATQIQGTLAEVQRSIEQMQGAIDRSGALARGQASALGEVQAIVLSLQHAVAELARG